jgi:hypothetical protein
MDSMADIPGDSVKHLEEAIRSMNIEIRKY